MCLFTLEAADGVSSMLAVKACGTSARNTPTELSGWCAIFVLQNDLRSLNFFLVIIDLALTRKLFFLLPFLGRNSRERNRIELVLHRSSLCLNEVLVSSSLD